MVTMHNGSNSKSSEVEYETPDINTTLGEIEICVGDIESPRNIPPKNYDRVSKRSIPLEGQYLLDLSLPPPPPSLFGIVSDADHKNPLLYSTSGSITAEVWIIHD
ncbi:hypothetical protein BJV74DRAFT_797690 [Russula compacta]|nr:hypothetical protein BJV74DRAFT_797690 [Russula compacta]